MQINILGLSAITFFIFFSTAFLLILFVKTEN
nr:photosystem II protein M [Poropsis sp. ID1_4]